MDLDIAFVSHVGRWRSENQDYFLSMPSKNIFAVADGMGGLAEGSTASRLACKAFSYQADHNTFNLPSYFEQAHDMILKLAEQKGLVHNQIGTTGVVLRIDTEKDDFTVCWCGDSRLYHFNAQTQYLEQVTVDHSYVQNLVNQGIITQEQAEQHPQKNIITNALGIGGPTIKTSTKRKALKENDILILCTDGLNNEVSHKEISDLCGQYGYNAQLLTEQLVAQALQSGGRDNVTVGIIVCKSAF